MEVFSGPDGVVRAVKVKCANGVTTRAMTKLCVLPMDEDQDS